MPDQVSRGGEIDGRDLGPPREKPTHGVLWPRGCRSTRDSGAELGCSARPATSLLSDDE
jgi:hypothetical protein